MLVLTVDEAQERVIKAAQLCAKRLGIWPLYTRKEWTRLVIGSSASALVRDGIDLKHVNCAEFVVYRGFIHDAGVRVLSIQERGDALCPDCAMRRQRLRRVVEKAVSLTPSFIDADVAVGQVLG